MAERSLRASSEIIKRAHVALKQKESNQAKLAESLSLDCQLIEKFFKGEVVDQPTFVSICKNLDINLREFTNKAPVSPPQNISTTELATNLVKKVKAQIKESIQQRCDRLRVLDMTQPIALSSVYVDTNVWQEIPCFGRTDIAGLMSSVDRGDRFSWVKADRATLPGLDAVNKHSKLLILGKPGAGKTTFLKQLALKCIADEFQPERVPLLLNLGDLPSSDSLDLLNLITQQFAHYGISDVQIVKQLLVEGKVLLLFDGLDEVATTPGNIKKIAAQIGSLADRFYGNWFAIACRTGTQELELEQFSIVEIADFNPEQILSFAQKWFSAIGNPEKSERFHKKLGHISELATSPLLLASICQVVDMPDFHNTIVREAFSLMLHRREQGNALSSTTTRKLLSDLARTAFEHNEFFFERLHLEQLIHSYLQAHIFQNLYDRPDEIDILDSLTQQGLLVERAKHIYSFSHLTMQEYLAARKIAAGDPQEIIEFISERIHETRWHGVIHFIFDTFQQTGQQSAQQTEQLLILMKQKIDGILATDGKLQRFLVWVQQQSQHLNVPYHQAAIRAFYMDIELDRTRVLDRARAVDLAHGRSLDRARIRALGEEQEMNTDMDIDHTLTLALNLDLAFFFAQNRILKLARTISPELDELLWQIRQELPDPFGNRQKFARWWQKNGMEWAKKLRNAIIHPRKVTHEWEFSEAEEKLLGQYCDANELLVQCIQISDRVSASAREDMMSSLLLAVAAE